jgi:transcription elongation factor Elf1
MADDSYLDLKYFIDSKIYNCPFCNRRHVSYKVTDRRRFDWTTEKICWAWFVKCDSCGNTSMHLTYDDVDDSKKTYLYFDENVDLDSAFFYSVPTSFFVIDARIPKIIRELITEAEGCIKMNYLTGASACCRKAIYELTIIEKAEGSDYEGRIKFLKKKFVAVDPDLFDVLCHIKDMTSDKVHEQSWDKWDSKHLKLFLETLKAVLHEIYVVPDEKKNRSLKVQDLLQAVKEKQKTGVATLKGQDGGE